MSVINIFLLLQIRLVLVRVELFDEINRYNMRFDATILLFINIERHGQIDWDSYVVDNNETTLESAATRFKLRIPWHEPDIITINWAKEFELALRQSHRTVVNYEWEH